MYAVVQTGGKQYRVSKGDVITVEKLSAEAGNTIALEDVMLIGGEGEPTVGTPFIDGAAVMGEVLENGKGKKVIIFKYKSKKDYRKKQGHRQPYTMIEIKDIVASGHVSTKPAPKAEAPKAAKAEAAPAEEKAVSLKSLKKAELIEYAATHGIEMDSKLTNAEMIATIEAAIK